MKLSQFKFKLPEEKMKFFLILITDLQHLTETREE